MNAPPSPHDPRGTTPAIVAVIIAALFALLTYSLDHEDYWYDELFTWNVAALPSPGAIWERLQSDTSPPVYFWALHAWQPVAEKSGLSFRWLSALGWLAGLAGFYAWMRLGFRRAEARLAALLLAFSPFWLTFGQELRMYSVYPAMLWWGAFFLTRAVRHSRAGDWLAVAALNALALWTHYHAAFFLLAEAAALGFYARRLAPSGKTALRRGVSFSVLVFMALTAPLFALLPYQISNSLTNISWLTSPPISAFITNFIIDFTILSFPRDPIWQWVEQSGVMVFYTFLGLGVLWRGISRHRHAAHAPQTNAAPAPEHWHFPAVLLSCTAFLIPVAMILLSFFPVKFFTPSRYAILALAPYLGCLSVVLYRYIASSSLRGMLVALLIGLNLASWWNLMLTRNKPQWSELAQSVNHKVKDGDTVIGVPDYWFNGFRMYLGRDVPVADFRELVLTSQFDDPTSHVFALIHNLAPGEDEFYPWKVLEYIEMHSRANRLHLDQWHTLMRYDKAQMKKIREWYLRRHLTGRMDIIAQNPVWFIGAEALAAQLPVSQRFPLAITNTGEVKCWLTDPPVRFTAPVTLPAGEHIITLKTNIHDAAGASQMRLALRVNDQPIQSFVIEEGGVVRISAQIKTGEPLVNPVIEWDGATFRPVDFDNTATDVRRLFLEFYWMAIITPDDAGN